VPPLKDVLLSLKMYRLSLIVTTVIGVGLLASMGLEALFRYLMLGVLEVGFSFDNAVVNATVLATMAVVWQRRFLTWGIGVAVFGMRLLFPIGIVSVTAKLSPWAVARLAFKQPNVYTEKLNAAHPEVLIACGTFLLLIFLDFIFEEREITWVSPIESRLAKVGKLDMVSIVITGVTIIALGEVLHNGDILVYGFASMMTYVVVNSLSNLLKSKDEQDAVAAKTRPMGVGTKVGRAAFATFVYLEVQDAAFSGDSVSGAFAVSSDIRLIVLGLGVGALFVRTMTVHLLRSGALDERSENRLVYLEHGANWAIGVLAALLLSELFVVIPTYVPGLVSVLLIAASVFSSIRYNKRRPPAESTAVTVGPDDAPGEGCER